MKMRKSIPAGILAVTFVAFGLGCMKMDSVIIVYPNGSASGTVTVAIDETYWNMSGEEMDLGNFTLIDIENATMWTEEGWVYFKTEELPISEENLSIQVTKHPEYTEYLIDANMSEFQEEGEEDEFNLSDPFTQMFLAQMTFKFTIEMPGEIVETNAHDWGGSTATWDFTGTTIQEADKLFVKSRMYVSEAFIGLFTIPLVGLLYRIGRGSRAG